MIVEVAGYLSPHKTNKKFGAILNACLIGIFLGLSVFLPRDMQNIKKIIFVIILIFNIVNIVSVYMYNKSYLWLVAISVGLPLYLVSISCIVGGRFLETVKGMYVFLYLFLIVVIEKWNIDYEKYFIIILKCYAVFYLFNLFLDFMGLIDIFENPLFVFLKNTNNITVFAKGQQYMFYYKVFPKGAFLQVILLAYATYRKQVFWMILSALCLAFTGSSVGVIIIPIVILFIILAYRLLKSKWLIYLCTLAIMVLGLLYVTGIFNIMMDPSDEFTNRIRLDIILAIVNAFIEEPWRILCGFGYGVGIYIPIRDSIEVLTEWSFLEFLRNFGVLGLVPFLAFLIKPIKQLWKVESDRWIIVAYLSYLILASTNPMLITSTAFCVYILVYSKYFYRLLEPPTLLLDDSSLRTAYP